MSSEAARTRSPSRSPLFVVLGAIGLVLLLALLWTTQDGGAPAGSETVDPGLVHIHGLGINPANGALFIATHTGLFRAEAGAQRAQRVGRSHQDTMGFTIVGPDRFLGSGHPDLGEMREQNLPTRLGLIESVDAGVSWRPIALAGEADFHVLRFSGERLYGYDASGDRLLTSRDTGRNWQQLARPGPLVDLAVDPRDPGHVLVTSVGGPTEGLFASRDSGESWVSLGGAVGLLTWPGSLYLVDGDGRVFVSADGGRRFERRGAIGGYPAALVGGGPDELFVALHDGTIKQSLDGGSTWAVRVAP